MGYFWTKKLLKLAFGGIFCFKNILNKITRIAKTEPKWKKKKAKQLPNMAKKEKTLTDMEDEFRDLINSFSSKVGNVLPENMLEIEK